MEALNMSMLNAGPLLADLRAGIPAFNVADNRYLNSSKDDERLALATSQHAANALGISEEELPEILRVLGIRSLTLTTRLDLTALAALSVDIPNAGSEPYQWHFLRQADVIRELQVVFQHCRTVAFGDWASLMGASDLWDGLLAEVIKPVRNQELEFIFYLGDVHKKLSFQVDEALDIISGFARHGRVTFALNAAEALTLWMVLNGVHPATPMVAQSPADLKKKYFSIFRTMSITRLLIYSANDVLLFANEQQFVLARRLVADSIELAAGARQDFIAGFSLGLLLQLDIAHCITLGLVVFGSYGELNACPEPRDLLAYIDRWVDDLAKPATMHLYQ